MKNNNITKILIFRTDRIGDLVNTSPILKSLKNYYNNSEIHLVCSSYNSAIALNYKFIDKEYDIEFFSSRLSIIDLKRRSNQPFKFQNFVIIFNGEIYNYIELRNKLISYGHKFSTNSDTEVLLKAYIHWGEKLVEYLDGMWAFSIYDLKKKNSFCFKGSFRSETFFLLQR